MLPGGGWVRPLASRSHTDVHCTTCDGYPFFRSNKEEPRPRACVNLAVDNRWSSLQAISSTWRQVDDIAYSRDHGLGYLATDGFDRQHRGCVQVSIVLCHLQNLRRLGSISVRSLGFGLWGLGSGVARLATRQRLLHFSRSRAGAHCTLPSPAPAVFGVYRVTLLIRNHPLPL